VLATARSNLAVSTLSQLGVAVVRSEKLAAEARTVRESRGRGTSVLESRYQATAAEVIEEFMCAEICRVCRTVKLLQLSVVTSVQ
jgi:hypothetical protein